MSDSGGAPSTASSEMEERVAKALAALAYDFASNNPDPGFLSREEIIASAWPKWIPFARAAIAAMREPSEAMREAFSAFEVENGFSDFETEWAKAVDAALQDKAGE